MAASAPYPESWRSRGAAAILMWCLVAGGAAVSGMPGSARAAEPDDQLPSGIDMARLSVLHSVPVLPTGTGRIAIHAEVDSAGTTAGMLGPGLCLTLFMGYADGSGGLRMDLESSLSVDGKVLILQSCQGRLKMRGFAADLSNPDVFDVEKGFEAFRQRPSLTVRSEAGASVIVGTVIVPRSYNDDAGDLVILQSTPNGLRIDQSTFDGNGRLVRIEDDFNMWREPPLAPELYATLGDTKRETTSERREVHIERDPQGRIQRLWLRRGWNRFDATGKRIKGTSPAAMHFAPRELLAQVEWSASGVPMAFSSGRDKQVPLHRSPDGRQLRFGSSDKPLAILERNAEGSWLSVRDASGEHTLFKDALSGQLLAYLPPDGCLHMFQAAGDLASARYKTQLRLRCGQAAPRQWESMFSRNEATGLIQSRTSIIDAKGSRTVYTAEP